MATIEELLSNVDLLLKKEPFYRGSKSFSVDDSIQGTEMVVGSKVRPNIPTLHKLAVSQETYMRELDPNCHNVLFDDNMPKICVKLSDGSMKDVNFTAMGVPYQKRIREKQTLVLSGNKTIHTLRGSNPSDVDKRNFAFFKECWEDRNMDGMRTKAIYAQKGVGDCGLLFYFNRMGETRCRLISYEDRYVIISHNDENGDRMLECVYYEDSEGKKHIDCYDDKYHHKLYVGEDGLWKRESSPHGFNEIPLVTKRGSVAWDDVQLVIEVYEIIFNLFLVIQKRHGWGILYIRGRFKTQAEQIAGSIILNDTSIDGKGTAEFKTPPSPSGILETLNLLEEVIMKGSSTTFLLPKDVKSSGDISALAIMLTQSLDLEGAKSGVIEWQNFMDKMTRLFKYGISKELVNSGENKAAVTEFERLRIGTKLKEWRPFNENEYNTMLATMKGAGILSRKTAIEKNTVSAPDEESRIDQEEALAQKDNQQAQQQQNAGTGIENNQ